LGTILYWKEYDNSEKEKDYEKYDLAHSNFFVLTNKIRMKLNIKESKHKDLINIIDKIEIMLEPENIEKHSQDDIEVYLKEIVVVSREIFKIEWDRSKKIFRI
jgi:hypothetical protein